MLTCKGRAVKYMSRVYLGDFIVSHCPENQILVKRLDGHVHVQVYGPVRVHLVRPFGSDAASRI
jgi:hypothetical protein